MKNNQINWTFAGYGNIMRVETTETNCSQFEDGENQYRGDLQSLAAVRQLLLPCFVMQLMWMAPLDD